METRPTYRIYDWIGRHVRSVTAVALVLVIGLAVGGSFVANTDDADFDPPGEVFDTAARADDTLSSDSSVWNASFLVEAPDGNALAPAAIREWHAAQVRVRHSEVHTAHLVDRFDPDSGVTTPGMFSIVDLVDANLPNGIDGATDAEITAAVTATLATDSPYADARFSLSEMTTTEEATDGTLTWIAPALIADVTYDRNTFDSFEATELWLREVQADVQEGAVAIDPIGIAIDADTAFAEAAEGSAPFIFLAVALIVALIAVVHRSYWSAVVAAAGLGATSLAYYGSSAFLGLKMGSLLLAFIVPIAMIGFGVDFFIHGVGRVREMQAEGRSTDSAYPAGMRAVIKALSLAAGTSIAAFLVNAVSGTEAIIEFGIGAAISLAFAYVILGQLAPRVVLGLEQYVGPHAKRRWSLPVYMLLMVLVAVFGGLMVALTAVMPPVGAAVLAAFLLLAVGLPALVSRRRNTKAAVAGKPTHVGLKGAGHGLEAAGALTWFVARWRKLTMPLVAGIGVVALVAAMGVQSGFDLKDLVSSDTDFVQSIERTGVHFPSSGEGSSIIFVEGDLTNPAALAALGDTVVRLSTVDAEFGRNSAGELLVANHAGDFVKMTMASPQAVSAIETSGATLTDADGNGIPDTAAGVRAVFDYVIANGVPTPDGAVAVAADVVPGVLADDGATGQATAIRIQVGSFTDGAIIQPVWDALETEATALEAAMPGLTASVTGDVITSFEGMSAFTRSMLTSLPLAIIITLLIAGAILRSVRYAIISVIPIGFVVAGIYAFMALAGYTVNVVTATIAAIAVGVGIDFSTHFTARFREEMGLVGDPLVAVRRAGSGTGGALVLSALTSVLGFAVMATAPTPIFATFGLLTAVMIALALAASLLVLPSLLVMAASRTETVEVHTEALEPAYAY
ncbi:MAG: MMPL family transporter [bacterium]|nr:MMPL family transporter [bacterium]